MADLRSLLGRCALAEGLRGPQREPKAQSRVGLTVDHLALAEILDSQQATHFHGCGLTPELRRTALRPCVGENYQNLHEAAKRSRLERIVRPLTPRSLHAQLEHGPRVEHANLPPGGGITGLSYAGAMGEGGSGKLFGLTPIAFCKGLAVCGLTPELSRAAARPWASEDHSDLHEAAKRARLERIVRPVPAVAFDQEPVN